MPANNGRPWTPEEVATLTQLRSQGLSCRKIATLMPTRTHKSIEVKCRHLRLPNLYKPTPPQRPRTKPRRPNDPDPQIPRAGKQTLPPLPSLSDPP